MFCVIGEEKNHTTPLCVLVGGGLIQQKNLVWKKHSTGHHRCAKTKKIQVLLSSLGRAGKEIKFVTLPPQCPPCLSAKPLSHRQPRSFWTLPQADPGGPNEMKVEYDPLSSYSPCPYLYPAVDPPEMGCLSPHHPHCSQPTHRAVGP